MREIKFVTGYDQILSFDAKDFKEQYEERVLHNRNFTQTVNGEIKHLAVCPLCDNAVVILGVYKNIDVAPHARHAKNTDIPNVTKFNEYRYLHCPYHKKRANYVKEYVPDSEVGSRKEIYEIAKNHFDKAIYILSKTTGIRINVNMAEELAKNYAAARVYNYIDATVYNIPWYLLYSYTGFSLHHLVISKDSRLYEHVKKLGFVVHDSRTPEHVYIDDRSGCALLATNYRYDTDAKGNFHEWLDFSIVRPDDKVQKALLYEAIDRFTLPVDSYHFANLISFQGWQPQQTLLDIAAKCMNP